MSEVLERVEGLDKRFVHYLESQGYIAPAKLPKQRIARREYSAGDLATIAAMWRYYRRGFSLQRAAALLARPDRVHAYMLLATPARQARPTLERLRDFDVVESAALIYGDVADLLIRVAAPDESDLYDLLVGAFATAHLSVAPVFLRVHPDYPYWRAPSPEMEPSMQAYCLLKVPAKQAGGVLDLLRDLPGVVEAAVVYGETDIITKIVAPSQAELDEIIMGRIQGIPTVESTRTFLVVGGLAWQRPDPPQ